MISKNYLNQNGEKLYILHFPGNGMSVHGNIITENLDRGITISDKLSIISVMNKECLESSPLKQQCDLNNIKIYNSAENEESWNNTLKIGYILECLNEITTDYVLILDGRDTCIVNNLDDEFIEKYKSLNCPIIFNGTPFAFPNVYVESINEIIHTKGKQKYINAGVCMGDKQSLIDFYTKAQAINEEYPSNNSEQFIIRMCRHQNPTMAKQDSESKIFRIIHHNDAAITKIDNDTIQIS